MGSLWVDQTRSVSRRSARQKVRNLIGTSASTNDLSERRADGTHHHQREISRPLVVRRQQPTKCGNMARPSNASSGVGCPPVQLRPAAHRSTRCGRRSRHTLSIRARRAAAATRRDAMSQHQRDQQATATATRSASRPRSRSPRGTSGMLYALMRQPPALRSAAGHDAGAAQPRSEREQQQQRNDHQ